MSGTRGAARIPFSPEFVLPEPPGSDRLRLEPLGPKHTELDYAAIMGSRVRLRAELEWKGWPSDAFEVESNRADLTRHRGELDRREAFAYTVLHPSGTPCLGCVYIEPAESGASVAFWVIDAEVESGLEQHLVELLLEWVAREWPLDHLVFPIRPVRNRTAVVLEAIGLVEADARDDAGHRCFEWRRT